MSDFDKAMEIVFANEGGYSRNPVDPGGETNFGLTSKSYPDLDIKNLTRSDAKNIYFRDYWTKHSFDQIESQAIAAKVFDLGVNIGPIPSIRILQQALQVFVAGPIVADGKIGPLTLEAIKEIEEEKLLRELRARYAHYHCDIVINQGVRLTGFMLGWLRRDVE